MLQRSILLFSLLSVAVGSANPGTQSTRGGGFPDFVYTVTKQYEPLAWMQGADRFSPDAMILVRDGIGSRPLVPGFAASADPAVSFDGQRVLFAGKVHAEDAWQIWETDLTGGKPRRITSFPEDCIRPLYLPDDRLVYAHKTKNRFVLETADLTGGKPLALTYLSGNSLPSDVLRDGRILFETGYPLGTGATPEIYTVYSDGSGIESYRCDHGPARHDARQRSSGDVVFTSVNGLARFTSARAQQVRISAPVGDYAGDIAEIDSGDWLLAWRPGAASWFRLMAWTPGAGELKPILSEPNLNIVQPVPLTQRTVPNRHPSGLHDWPNANLLCLNAYTSKYQFAPQSIYSVRLYTRDERGTTKLLGTAPVERDGSFFVQVLAEQPLQIELLDAAGKSLKRESGFFWMRRGEQRGCVGCHAGPEIAPENAVPMTLLKSTIPADLTGNIPPSAAGGH